MTRSQLCAMMDTMMGGRAAEEMIFGIEKITSGASSDLKVGVTLHFVAILSVIIFQSPFFSLPASYRDCFPHGEGMGNVGESWASNCRGQQQVPCGRE